MLQNHHCKINKEDIGLNMFSLLFVFVAIAFAIPLKQTDKAHDDSSIYTYFSSPSLNGRIGNVAQSLIAPSDVDALSGTVSVSFGPSKESNSSDESFAENLSRSLYSRQTPGAICKPKAHVGQSSESPDDSSKKTPEPNPSEERVNQTPRGPCYAYEDKEILLTCAGPECTFQGRLTVANCVSGKPRYSPTRYMIIINCYSGIEKSVPKRGVMEGADNVGHFCCDLFFNYVSVFSTITCHRYRKLYWYNFSK